MRQIVRWSVVIAALLMLIGLSQSGMLASLDQRLDDWRLGVRPLQPSGTVVVVEIDSKSLSEVGVWPWPRSLHADLLERLMTSGAEEVVLDLDLSNDSEPWGDAILTASLERAAGKVHLAAQGHTAGFDTTPGLTRPLPEFAALASTVLVNVLHNATTGRVHSLVSTTADDTGVVLSLPVALSRPQFAVPDVLQIDFSLDIERLPRLSYTDVLYGRIDPAFLFGKQVIVGAGAPVLRDVVNVPNHGIISGPMVQALALETLKAGRLLTNWGHAPGLLLTAACALFMLLRQRSGIGIRGITLLVCVPAIEAVALYAYVRHGLILQTASMHFGLLLLFGLVLADNGYHQLLGRRAALKRLQFLATHDPATGFLSRQGLIEGSRSTDPQMVIALQPQGIKELRATLGHDMVEALIVQFAHRLEHCGFGAMARIAPPTFALIANDHGDADRLAATAKAIATNLSGIYLVDDHQLFVDVSAGYAAGPFSTLELVNRAETALIQARANRVHVRGFSMADQEAMARHRRLDRDLRGAIKGDQLRLLYQPQVDLRTRRLVGAETLMRWDHPELGLISPAEFIPLAEETGLIIDLGQWLLDEACMQAAQWPSSMVVAINVSPIQFQQSDLVDVVGRALERSGLPPSRLELEITESSRVTNPSLVSSAMWRLQKLGVRLSVDDFGTGYSSLIYFRDLPFDTVKIDQSFVRDRTSPDAEALLAAIIELARRMGKHTVAEGIEDETTAALLARLGCTYGQGYHFSRPVPGDRLARMLARQSIPQAV